jgi:hypothetical protein
MERPARVCKAAKPGRAPVDIASRRSVATPEETDLALTSTYRSEGKLMRHLLGAAAVALTGSLLSWGCGQSVDDATQKFCSDLQNLRASVQTVKDMDSSTAVGTLDSARDDIRTSLQTLRNDASDIAQAKLDKVDQAFDNLDSSVHSVDENTTIASAVNSLSDSVDSLKAAAGDLRQRVNCD